MQLVLLLVKVGWNCFCSKDNHLDLTLKCDNILFQFVDIFL